jgi:hypothetical protein
VWLLIKQEAVHQAGIMQTKKHLGVMLMLHQLLILTCNAFRVARSD